MKLIEMESEFKEYLENKYYSKNTINTYISNFKKFLIDTKISEVEELTPGLFAKYKENLEQEKRTGQTINLKFEAIRSFLKFLCLKKNIIAPVVEVKDNRYRVNLPPIKIRIYDFYYKKELSIHEIKRILRVIDKEAMKFYKLRNKILIELLATTGLRISEALQLNIDDVITGRVEVVGKRKKIRTVIIPATIIKACREFRKYRKELYLVNKKLFISTTDKEVKSRALALVFERAGLAAKVPKKKLFLHNLRHFYTIDSIKSGMDLNTLAQNLGIEDMEVLKIYQARDIKAIQEVANKKGRRLNV